MAGGDMGSALFGLESVGGLASGEIPRTPPPYTCNLCGRSRLNDWHAAMQHVAARHTEELMRTVTPEVCDAVMLHHTQPTSESERFEDALISVCNADTLEEAVSIATTALSGDATRERSR